MSVINEYTYIYSSNIRARQCYFRPWRSPFLAADLVHIVEIP